MLSTRYVIPVIILLALALIPTTIHSYINAKVDDGKSVHNIAPTLNNFTSMPSKRNARWGMDIFYSEDWFERDYQNERHDKVRLFTARSFNHKSLYHHPELALSHGYNNLKKHGILSLPESPEIPVHVLSNNDNSMYIAYVFLYNDEFIKDPIIHQFGDSIKLLVNPSRPMTLFYASQSGLPSNTQFDQSALASVLNLAIQSFQTQSTATVAK